MSNLETQKTIDINTIPLWGKLIRLNSGLSSYPLIKDTVVIGRTYDCDIAIVDKRLSSQHCQIEKTETGIILKDLSSNGTFIDKLKIGKNNQINLTNGSEFWLLPASRVKPAEAIGFRLEIPNESNGKNEEAGINDKKAETNKSEIKEEKKDEEKEKQKELEKEEKTKVEKQRNEQDEQLKEEITCAFCFEIMCIPVSVQPCNHRFCGGCLTELVKKGKGECIKCRKTLTSGVKDASFNSIIDLYLKTHPEDKRDAKDVEEQTTKNIFTFDPTDIVQIITGKPAKKKVVPPPVNGRGSRRRVVRTGSDLSASDEDEARCRECMTSRNGFQCAAGQKHVGCLTCGKLMADRDNRSLHQNCVLCTQYFCNLYYPPCSKTGIKLKQLSTFRNEAKIDKELLRANTFEFEYLRNYLMSKKLTSKEVFDFVIKKIEKNEFAYLFDRKIMRVAPTVSKEVKIEADDSVCDSCWKDLWFQMVFFYRTELAADMPSSVRDRPTCYWGINCKTMSHKEDHAKTYNHMVFQSRF